MSAADDVGRLPTPPPSRAGSRRSSATTARVSTGPVETQNVVTEKIRRISVMAFETSTTIGFGSYSTQGFNGTLLQMYESERVTHTWSRRTTNPRTGESASKASSPKDSRRPWGTHAVLVAVHSAGSRWPARRCSYLPTVFLAHVHTTIDPRR